MELSDKEFEQVMEIIYKYYGTVQFSVSVQQVADAQKTLKKDIETVLTKINN